MGTNKMGKGTGAAPEQLGGTAIKPEGWDRTGMEAFKYFLYNPKTGEILSRTPLSWVKITVFYTIYYSCLAGFWLACLNIFFLTLPNETSGPKWKQDYSLLDLTQVLDLGLRIPTNALTLRCSSSKQATPIRFQLMLMAKVIITLTTPRVCTNFWLHTEKQKILHQKNMMVLCFTKSSSYQHYKIVKTCHMGLLPSLRKMGKIVLLPLKMLLLASSSNLTKSGIGFQHLLTTHTLLK